MCGSPLQMRPLLLQLLEGGREGGRESERERERETHNVQLNVLLYTSKSMYTMFVYVVFDCHLVETCIIILLCLCVW